MGKRKKSSRAPAAPKRKQMLATTFNCLFCSHENSVSVKIDKKAALGSLACKVCGQHWQTTTNYLSAPVDVYADWVDACELVNGGGGGGGGDGGGNGAKDEEEENEKDRAFSSYATSGGGGGGGGGGRGGGGGGGRAGAGAGAKDDDDDDDDILDDDEDDDY